MLARTACAAAEVLGSVGELMAMEGTQCPEGPLTICLEGAAGMI